MSSLTDQIGRVLAGRYRLVAPVGTGASAHVYAADDVVLSRRVAVKVLHPALVGDQAFLRRFRAEARAAASLNHPHVMRVFDWGEDADGPFLVLEFLGGGSLRDLLDAGHLLTPAQAAVIGAQAADGLAYAHRRGFVHRDVKPANILFDDEGSLRVADFGLARALAEAAWTEPTGAVLGTARYASPEQAEGRIVDDRADVYSLALVLFESITGWVPFSADTTVATLMARLGAHLPIVPELGPLGTILGQAAIPEPLARLDAPSLALDLEIVGRDLGAPAPLPLAGSGQLSPPDRDPTLTEDPYRADRRRAVQAGIDTRPARPAPDPLPGVPRQPAAGAPVGWEPVAGAAPAAALGTADGTTAAAAGDVGPALAAGAGAATGAAASRRRPPPAPRDAQPRGRRAPRQRPTSAAPAAPAPPPAPPATRRPEVAGGTAASPLTEAYPQVPAAPAKPAGSKRPPRRAAARRVPEAAPESARRAPKPVRPRAAGRRWSRKRTVALSIGVAVALIVVATLATGAGVQAYRRLAGTGHVVPRLVGMTLPNAESAATGVDLRVVVTGHRYDGSLPAGEIVTQSLQQGANEKGGTAVDVVLSLGAAPVPVPSLTGDDAQAAQAALASGHLTFASAAAQYSETVPSGLAIQWSPSGTDVRPGTTVTVTFSLGPKPRIVPGLRFDTWADAQSALQALRLVPVEALSYSTSVPKGEVISTYPVAETSVPRGTPVTVDVSKGPQYVTVPRGLVGQSAQQAAAELTGEGLVVLGTYGVGSSVIYSVPTPGTSVQVGTGVTLYTI